jgi:predicted PolB exonuclease-like 3'-5' exonuclease
MLRIENLLTREVIIGTNFKAVINAVRANMRYDLKTHEYHLIRNDKAKNFYLRFVNVKTSTLLNYIGDYKRIENEFIKIERVK